MGQKTKKEFRAHTCLTATVSSWALDDQAQVPVVYRENQGLPTAHQGCCHAMTSPPIPQIAPFPPLVALPGPTTLRLAMTVRTWPTI